MPDFFIYPLVVIIIVVVCVRPKIDMNWVRNRLRRIRGVGISGLGFGGSITISPDETDKQLINDLVKVLDDSSLDQLVPDKIISYYQLELKPNSPVRLFENRGKIFPILIQEDWLADPAIHTTGFHPRLTLNGRKAHLGQPKLAREYLEAIQKLNRQFVDNPAFAVLSIGKIEDNGVISIEVQISKYSDYISTSEILNAELRLELGRLGLASGKLNLPLRNAVGVLNFDRYMTKIGLNVLTAQRMSDGYHFYVMDRSNMVMRRPLEYSNSIHVVPAGTIQPEGAEFLDETELNLNTTLIREYSEEFFNSGIESKKQLENALNDNSSARFFITAFGLDGLTQKLEICGLLILEKPYIPNKLIQSSEGLIKCVNRSELETYAQQVDKILPAGALSIWQGLKFLDKQKQEKKTT